MVYQIKPKQRLAAVVAASKPTSFKRIRRKLMAEQHFSEVLFFCGEIKARDSKRIAKLFDLDLLIVLQKSTHR